MELYGHHRKSRQEVEVVYEPNPGSFEDWNGHMVDDEPPNKSTLTMERERLEGHLRSISREIKEMKRTGLLEAQVLREVEEYVIENEDEEADGVDAAFESGHKLGQGTSSGGT